MKKLLFLVASVSVIALTLLSCANHSAKEDEEIRINEITKMGNPAIIKAYKNGFDAIKWHAKNASETLYSYGDTSSSNIWENLRSHISLLEKIEGKENTAYFIVNGDHLDACKKIKMWSDHKDDILYQAIIEEAKKSDEMHTTFSWLAICNPDTLVRMIESENKTKYCNKFIICFPIRSDLAPYIPEQTMKCIEDAIPDSLLFTKNLKYNPEYALKKNPLRFQNEARKQKFSVDVLVNLYFGTDRNPYVKELLLEQINTATVQELWYMFSSDLIEATTFFSQISKKSLNDLVTCEYTGILPWIKHEVYMSIITKVHTDKEYVIAAKYFQNDIGYLELLRKKAKI